MTFDQAQSPRLGQKTPVEATYVRIFAGTEIPEAAWPGQMIFRSDTQVLQVYSELGGWLDVVSGVAGILTFVGSSIPTSQSVGDMWFDTGHSYRLYVATSVGATTIGVGAWVLAQDSAAALAAANSAQSAAATAVALTTDGSAPSSSPTPILTPGIGSIFVTWAEVSNANPVQYDVHISTTTGFTPSTSTLVGTGIKTGPVVITSLHSGTALVNTTTYYVKIVARDPDGSAAAGPQASGSPGQAGTVNIANGAITAAQVSANAITAGAIAANAVTSATIAAGAVTTTSLAANSVTATAIAATAIDGKTITGATIQTAASGARWVVSSSGSTDTITGYTGAASELVPATLNVAPSSTFGYPAVTLTGPRTAAGASAPHVDIDAFGINLYPQGVTAGATGFIGTNVSTGTTIGRSPNGISGMEWGIAPVLFSTSDNNNTITMPHSLGVTPAIVLASPANTSVWFGFTGTKSSSSVVIGCRRWDGVNVAAGTTVNVHYLIISQ